VGTKAKFSPLFRSLKFLLTYKVQAAGSLFCLMISTGSELILPKISQYIIDEGISLKNMEVVLYGALIIAAFALARSLFSFLQGYLSVKASQGVAYDLRNSLYAHIQKLSFSYHDRSQTGQLLTRTTSDVELIKQFIGIGVIQFINAILLIAGSFILLFITNWLLTLIVLPVVFIIILIFFLFARRGFPLFKIVQQKIAELNTRLQETIICIPVVKAFAREDFEIDRFDRKNIELKEIGLKVGRMFAIGIPLIFSMSNVGTLLIVWAGGYQILAQNLTIGELVAFQNYLLMAMFPLLMLGMIMMGLSAAAAGANRIFEVLDAESEVKERPDAKELPQVKGNVVFENVCFRYFKKSEEILRDISFQAEPGQTIALLGATGSGKSTIVNLIPRFYDVSLGRITIDGWDIRNVTLDSLRRQIGIVLQETILFSGTIRHNIAYGRKEASMDEIIHAAKTAEAHEFINEFPEGYNTVVGERGVTLSGGQKQRIAIARALLVQPKILILDDSTSSVDYKTERKIEQALERLKKGRLCFIIAQRISTVQSSDKIIVLDRGEISAMGDHTALLRESPLYAEIYYSDALKRDGKVT
jgi:ATP-binding cassette subfamily B multidrug efflux pump